MDKDILNNLDRYTQFQMKRDKIRRLRDEGKSLQEIAKELGVSRQRIQQQCVKYGIDSSPIPAINESPIQVLATLRTFRKISDAAKHYGISSERLKTYCRQNNINIKTAIAHGRAHFYDNKTYGWWTVLPGTYQRVHIPGNKTSKAVVDCKCVCGTVKEKVMLANLEAGLSRGCGCRTKEGGRVHTPWKHESGETSITFPTTKLLAEELDVSYLFLIKIKNTGKTYTDSQGREWIPQHDQAIPWSPPDVSRDMPVVMIEGNEVEKEVIDVIETIVHEIQDESPVEKGGPLSLTTEAMMKQVYGKINDLEQALDKERQKSEDLERALSGLTEAVARIERAQNKPGLLQHVLKTITKYVD